MRATPQSPESTKPVPGRLYGTPRRRIALIGPIPPSLPDHLAREGLESIADQIALLDRHGRVILTNASWDYAAHDSDPLAGAPRAENYLDRCSRAAASIPAAARAFKGIGSVLRGETERFRMEYAHQSGSGRRWHVVLVSPLRRREGGALIIRTDATRQRAAQRQVRALSRMLLAAHERERRAIARELHDDVTQQVAAAAIDLSVLISRAGIADTGVRDELKTIVGRLRALGAHVHGLSRRMHPHTVETLGLARALEGECRSFAQRTGIGMTTKIQHPESPIPPPVALAAFRICQEALKNAEKHARATSVAVTLDGAAGELRLSVADTGVGFNISARRPGIGLCGMRERAMAVGGRVSISSVKGRGASIKLTVPLHQESADDTAQNHHR